MTDQTKGPQVGTTVFSCSRSALLEPPDGSVRTAVEDARGVVAAAVGRASVLLVSGGSLRRTDLWAGQGALVLHAHHGDESAATTGTLHRGAVAVLGALTELIGVAGDRTVGGEGNSNDTRWSDTQPDLDHLIQRIVSSDPEAPASASVVVSHGPDGPVQLSVVPGAPLRWASGSLREPVRFESGRLAELWASIIDVTATGSRSDADGGRGPS